MRQLKAAYKARHDLAIGELLIESGNTADGLNRYEQAAAIDPTFPLVHIGHTMALLRAAQVKLAAEAIAQVREPTASDSWDIEYWHARGLIAGRLGDNTAAQLAITELTKLDHGLYFNSQRITLSPLFAKHHRWQSPHPKQEAMRRPTRCSSSINTLI